MSVPCLPLVVPHFWWFSGNQHVPWLTNPSPRSAFLTWCSPCVYSSGSSCLLVMYVHTQDQPTLCDPMDCSPPGSSLHGTFQARVLEWVAISASRRSSQPRDWSCVSWGFCVGRQVLRHRSAWEAPHHLIRTAVLRDEGHTLLHRDFMITSYICTDPVSKQGHVLKGSD